MTIIYPKRTGRGPIEHRVSWEFIRCRRNDVAVAPRFYRLAWREPWVRSDVFYPVGFHLIVRWTRSAWRYVRARIPVYRVTIGGDLCDGRGVYYEIGRGALWLCLFPGTGGRHMYDLTISKSRDRLLPYVNARRMAVK